MPAVRVADAVKNYRQGQGEVHALRGVSLTLESGDFAALWGPSGSGKTTLLNLIGGLDSPTSGSVFLGDLEISSMPESHLSDVRLRHIGFVFQAYNLIPVFTAYENVELVLVLQGIPSSERRRRVMEVFEALDIGSLAARRPAEMSGGQQQRVAVARAIVSQPDIVLADEPTANLDSVTGERLMELMRRLNEDMGITFLFSTHDSMVMDRARRLIHIRDGRIVEDTTAQ